MDSGSFWLKIGCGVSLTVITLAIAAKRLLSTSSLISSCPTLASWKDVYSVLTREETRSAFSIPCSVVTGYAYNTFAANKPNEDTWNVAVYEAIDGTLRHMFGIFDGHSTRAASYFCQQELFGFIERRLHMLDRTKQRQASAFKDSKQREHFERMFAEKRDILVEYAIEMAFRDVDQYFITESIITHLLQGDSFDRCVSGSCVITAFVENDMLYIANLGDSRAVLGVQMADGSVTAVELSTDQNTDNVNEVRLIQQAHANDPKVVTNGRIKGILRPTRNIGGALLKEIVTKEFVAPNFLPEPWEPPYTTCKPEITKRRLGPNDRYLILASDGLWDLMSSQEAIDTVHEYECMKRDNTLPPDFTGNAATYLILKCLERVPLSMRERSTQIMGSQADDSIDPKLEKLNCILQLPDSMRRSVYDDISVIIVYIDTARIVSAASEKPMLARPLYPQSIERVEKYKAIFANNNNSRRSVFRSAAKTAAIQRYLQTCWPTNSNLWTKKNCTTIELFSKLGLPDPTSQLVPPSSPSDVSTLQCDI